MSGDVNSYVLGWQIYWNKWDARKENSIIQSILGCDNDANDSFQNMD